MQPQMPRIKMLHIYIYIYTIFYVMKIFEKIIYIYIYVYISDHQIIYLIIAKTRRVRKVNTPYEARRSQMQQPPVHVLAAYTEASHSQNMKLRAFNRRGLSVEPLDHRFPTEPPQLCKCRSCLIGIAQEFQLFLP